eukprot:COSAG02_NODE_3500_length_6650_cov_4.876355_4_plen_40_part_00
MAAAVGVAAVRTTKVLTDDSLRLAIIVPALSCTALGALL